MSTLDQYLSFVTVVETQNLTKGASKLNLSPSTVSKHLTKLEERLGVRLIDRNTTSFSVTETGTRFYSECKSVLKQITDIEVRLNEDITRHEGVIVLTLARVLATDWFFRKLSDFTYQYPEILLDIRVSDNRLNLIEQGIDFAIRMGDLADNRLVSKYLTSSPIILCASKKYIDQTGMPESIDDLKGHKITIPNIAQFNMTDFLKNLGNHSLELQELLSGTIPAKSHHLIDDIHVHIKSVVHGLGISMIFRDSIKEELESGEMIHLFPELPTPSISYSLVYHNRDYMPARMKVFKLFIENIFS